MALPTTGQPISLALIQDEFGGVAPIGLDEYYQGAGTGYVTASNYNPAGQIPTSGPISLANFWNVSKVGFSVTGPASVNEGSSAVFNVTSTTNGTLHWVVEVVGGTVSNADFVGSQMTGTFTVSGNVGSFSVPIAADSLTEGAETFRVRISTSSPSGPFQAISGFVTINDTSLTPASFTFNDVVSTNTIDYNLVTRATNAGWNGTVALIATITINAGVYVYSSSTGVAAFRVTSLPAGSSVTVTNNGIIAGRGGNGGTGGNAINNTLTNGAVGGTGGTALSVAYAIDMYNNGTIGGGGGGGGGGGAAYLESSDKSGTFYQAASGGGGGGGRTFGAAGFNGTAFADPPLGAAYGPDAGATAGTLFAPGSGSSSGNVGSFGPDNGPGGAGGALGQPGFPGSGPGGQFTAASSPGAGGAAGNAVVGGANVSWYSYGQRLGPIDHPGINMLPGGVGGALFFNVSNFTTTQFVESTASFDTNGNVRSIRGEQSQPATIQDEGDWYTPNSAGVGAAYWARVTRASGSAFGYSGSTLNTWIQLNTNVFVTHTLSSMAFGSSFATYNVEISNNGGTSTLVTHTVEIYVEMESVIN